MADLPESSTRRNVDLVHESASKSLEAAAARGTAFHSNRRVMPHGRSIDQEQNVVYDTKDRKEGERHPALKVDIVAHVISDNVLEHRQGIAVNDSYICYTLKPGYLRIICRKVSGTCMAKGHLSGPLTDVRFFSDTSNAVVTAGKDGQVILWHVSGLGEAVSVDQVGVIKYEDFDSSKDTIHLSWCPGDERLLATAFGMHLVLWTLPKAEDKTGFAYVCELEDPPTAAQNLMAGIEAELTCLGFSPDGLQLSCGTSDGKVYVWDKPFQGVTAISFEAFEGRKVGSVSWLSSASQSLLLTGDECNEELKLWRFTESSHQLIQTVAFSNGGSPDGFFNRMAVENAFRLVILSNTKSERTPAIYTLHLGPEDDNGNVDGFDYIAEFTIGVPVVSMQACGSIESDGEGIVHVFCQQTSGIQYYELAPAMCCPPEPQEKLEPPRQPTAAGVLMDVTVPAFNLTPSSEQALPASEPSQEPAETMDGLPSLSVGKANSEGNEARQTIQPNVAVRNRLLSASSIEHSPVRVLTPHMLTSGNFAFSHMASSASMGSADVASSSVPLAAAPQALQSPQADLAAGGMVRQHPSLGSDPHGSTAATNAIRSQLGILPSLQPFADQGPSLHEPPGVSATPSSDVSHHGVGSADGHPAGTVEGHLTAAMQVLRRSQAQEGIPHVLQGGLVQAPAPPDWKGHLGAHDPVPNPAPLTAFEVFPHHTRGAHAAPEPRPAFSIMDFFGKSASTSREGSAAHGAVGAPPASVVEGSRPFSHDRWDRPPPISQREPALILENVKPFSDILDRIAEVQKKLQHLGESNKEDQLDMREELKKESNRLELFYRQEVEAMRAMVAEERRIQQGEEQQRLKDLLRVLSESINKDLVLKVQDVVRREVVAEAEKSRKAFQKSLESLLPVVLPKLLQDTFKSTFEAMLLPAFESACQSMFAQVSSALDKGLTEQVESSKGILASSLKEAVPLGRVLAQAEQVVAQNAQLAEALKQSLEQTQGLLSGPPLANGAAKEQQTKTPERVKELCQHYLLNNNYQKAFEEALESANRQVVEWLCLQVDPAEVFSMDPLPFSQEIMLTLLHQLGNALDTDLMSKLDWVRESSMAVAKSKEFAEHVPGIVQAVMANLQQQMSSVKQPELQSKCRVVLHCLNATLMDFK